MLIRLQAGLVVAALVTACSAPADRSSGAAETETGAEAIVGASLDTGDPSVGVFIGGGRMCNGVLIAPDVVLTAASCAPSGPFYTGDGAPEPSTSVIPPNLTPHAIKAEASFVPPSPPGFTILGVRLVLLDAPVAGAVPVPLLPGDPTFDTPCRAVSFGTPGGAPSTLLAKRAASVSAWSDGYTLHISGASFAYGDDGAPLVCNDAVGGFVYAGGSTHGSRIEPSRAWIAQQVDAWHPPPPPPPPPCSLDQCASDLDECLDGAPDQTTACYCQASYAVCQRACGRNVRVPRCTGLPR